MSGIYPAIPYHGLHKRFTWKKKSGSFLEAPYLKRTEPWLPVLIRGFSSLALGRTARDRFHGPVSVIVLKSLNGFIDFSASKHLTITHGISGKRG